MRLTEDTLKQLSDPNLTADERALLRCRLAADLIHTGQYETARDALGDLWQGVGERPGLTGLEPQTAAEVLLQCGVLSGWLGSVRQIPGAQERAKDLLTDAQRRFQSQGRTAKVAEVYYELGKCYFRLGAYDDSRVILDEGLDLLGDSDHELKAKVLIRRTLVEIWTGRYHDALAILERAREFFEASSDALKGRWHGQTALVLRRLATAEQRSDYADRAIVEFTAAIYHYEQAGHERYSAINLNNLAMLLYTLGRYEDAHENLDRAVRLFKRLEDDGLLAQVNETRARVLVAEGRYGEADGVIVEVIKTLKKGGENALLADALTIQGVVWARTELHEQSINVLRHALTVAQDSGASSNAAHAALTLIEEHGQARLTDYDLYHTYRLADGLLKDTQDAEDIARLRACAGIVVKRLSGAQVGEKNFSLRKAILAYEAKCIEQALRAAQGKVTRAAKMLGIGYQSLGEILKGRQKKLRHLRTPPRIRKKWAARATRQTDPRTAAKGVRPATVLHVEDSRPVANAVRDILEVEGLSVVTCDDGAKALRILADKEHYDLLLFDNALPHADGIELISRARQLPHRRRTPIIMLSASDVEVEAWRAGADAFLRKPDDIERLPETVKRLLSKGL
jgi:CheY-like chemotaxis protein/Tfp pilus assembly protein PilF